jgi:hypothetical protein
VQIAVSISFCSYYYYTTHRHVGFRQTRAFARKKGLDRAQKQAHRVRDKHVVDVLVWSGFVSLVSLAVCEIIDGPFLSFEPKARDYVFKSGKAVKKGRRVTFGTTHVQREFGVFLVTIACVYSF